MLPRFLT
jgi:hypothetical protein